MTPEQRKHFEFVRDEMHGEPQQQKVVWDEPVAWKATWGGETKVFLYQKPNEHDFDDIIPLYTTPQQRTWVGLTDDEIRSVEFDHIRRRDYARAIEAKLKEKNT